MAHTHRQTNKHTNTQTDMATLWLTQPRGPSQWKLVSFSLLLTFWHSVLGIFYIIYFLPINLQDEVVTNHQQADNGWSRSGYGVLQCWIRQNNGAVQSYHKCFHQIFIATRVVTSEAKNTRAVPGFVWICRNGCFWGCNLFMTPIYFGPLIFLQILKVHALGFQNLLKY